MFSGLLQHDPAAVVSGVKEFGLQTFVWGFHCCNQEVGPVYRLLFGGSTVVTRR